MIKTEIERTELVLKEETSKLEAEERYLRLENIRKIPVLIEESEEDDVCEVVNYGES